MADTSKPKDPPTEKVEPTPVEKSEPPPEKKEEPVKKEAPIEKPTIVTNKIPAMNKLEFARMFSRMDADYTIVEHTLQVANQDTMPGAVFDFLEELVTYTLPMTRDEFIRVWKTLMIKRVQDIFESEKSRRSDNFIRIIRNIPLPAPLGDLLHSLGHFFSAKTGRSHHLIPPSRAATPENFWTVDAAILEKWIHLICELSPVYTVKEYPSLSQCADRPMLLTTVSSFTTPQCYVKSYTNETKMTDGFIHALQDDLFTNPDFITFDNSHLIMTNSFDRAEVRRQYIRSYATDHPS